MYILNITNPNGSALPPLFIKQSICTIGDSDSNIVNLPGRKVAKVHAQVEFRDDGIHISNRARLKPLFVNEDKIENFGPLTMNDTIMIGDYRISITIAGQRSK